MEIKGEAVDSDGMCNEMRPERRCVCREEFGYRVCGKDQTAERGVKKIPFCVAFPVSLLYA